MSTEDELEFMGEVSSTERLRPRWLSVSVASIEELDSVIVFVRVRV